MTKKRSGGHGGSSGLPGNVGGAWRLPLDERRRAGVGFRIPWRVVPMIAFSGQTIETQAPSTGGLVEQPVPVLVYLSGSSRGKTLRLGGEWLRIGTAPGTEVPIPPLTLPRPAAHHATLVRRGRTYQIVAEPGCDVWVNGEPTRSLALASGDLLEIGRDGALLRFRLYPPDSPAHKSLPEVFADCVDCARYSGRGPVGRLSLILGQMPREMALQTSVAFRAGLVLVLLAVGVVSGYAVLQGSALQNQVGLQATQLGQMSDLLEAARRESLTPEELADILRSAPAEGVMAETVRQMSEQLARSDERLAEVEGKMGAAARVATLAAGSTALILGSYGFVAPGDGRALRFRVGPGGAPLPGADGTPTVTYDGAGPPVEMQYTGTAFLVSADGLLVTNRHMAVPWDYDPVARRIVAGGARPVLLRYVAYLPGQAAPGPVAVVAAGPDTRAPDVALLRLASVPPGLRPLELRAGSPPPGEEVFVVGYPLGIRAIVARAGTAFMESLRSDGGGSMWEVTQKLADQGLISPLVTRGIVGQVTEEVITYDAQTTSGGSGGPVLDGDGRVVAVNMAILPDFAGSNLGVPGARVRELLARSMASAR